MNFIKKLFLATYAIPFICAANPGTSTYTLSKGYMITIDGTSNLHSWNETVNTVSGTGAINLNNDGSIDLEAINIRMEVHSIKSDMGAVMNNNTYKALKADAYPEIIFTLNGPVKFVRDQTTIVTVKGNLTIAGVTRGVNMQVKVSMQEPGKLIFEGSQTVNMTDYGIDPPTALFGTLKTGDAITITFKTSFISSTNL